MNAEDLANYVLADVGKKFFPTRWEELLDVHIKTFVEIIIAAGIDIDKIMQVLNLEYARYQDARAHPHHVKSTVKSLLVEKKIDEEMIK